jgi:hypothetical protein
VTPSPPADPRDSAQRLGDQSPRLIQCGDGSRVLLDVDQWTITLDVTVRFPVRKSVLALLTVEEAEHLIAALTYWVAAAREEGA